MSPLLRISLVATLLLMIVLGGATWYWLGQSPSTTTSIGTSTPNGTPVPLDLSPHEVHVLEHGTYYDAHTHYPSSTPLLQTAGAAANAAAVETMKVFSQNLLESFKGSNNLASMTPQQITAQGLDHGQKYSLSDDYDAYAGANTVSYVFSITEDTLGAHPNTYFRTFTFNLKTGQSLALSDLFQPTANYVDAVSTLTRAALIKQQGSAVNPADFINPGTTANADNFQNFAIDGSNLVIFFPPYQVASYAAGPQIVRIPLSQLSALLQSSY
jgi:hypothetical protein